MKKIIVYINVLIILLLVLGCLLFYFIKDNSYSDNVGSYTISNSITSTTVISEAYNKTDLFTDSDLEQSIDTSNSTKYSVSSGQNININKEGTYVITGTSSNTTIYVEAGDEEKVHIVLDGVNITNSDFPCIYIKSGDKIFITTKNNSSLSVTGTFKSDGDIDTDAVIYSKSDITLNGTAKLTINSTDNGIVSKDDLKVTGGTYVIKVSTKGLDANDSIAISGGDITIEAGTDGLHAEYSDDDSVGYIFISDANININAGDDGIHGTTVVQIEGGTININAKEGIEGTSILINDGEINIKATDDGINAGNKSTKYKVKVEINGGNITINMGQGDTDAIDANGDLLITGGEINITARSAFDYDGTGSKTGGTIIVNGTEIDSLTNQMMGGQNGRRQR